MRVAITFDAELPGREHHWAGAPERILDELRVAGVRATFFVQGRWALAEPHLAQRIAEEGHLVGSHGHHHAPMTNIRDLLAEVEAAELAIRHACGVFPGPWFRCPFGAVDTRVLELLQARGRRHVGWDLQVADWEPSTTADDVVQRAVHGVQDGSVLLLHTWPRPTAMAMFDLIVDLRAKGAEFVTVDQLERVPEGCP